jgi:RND family efflux transporter MFP subunit
MIDMRGKTTRLAVSLTVLALTCACARRPSHTSAAAPDEPPTVAVAKATNEDISNAIVLTAEFKPFQEVDVMAKVSGYLKEIKVDVGDRVEQGQLLATLEVPELRDDLSKADAAVVRAQAEVARAQDELRRAESSHQIAHLSFERLSGVLARKPGLLAQQEIDEAKSRDLVAEAQVAAAKSSIAAVEEQVKLVTADTRKVKTLIDYTRVTAPFSGVITRRYGDPGSMIQAGTASQTQAMPVVKLSQTSTLRLILPVPESSVPSVHIGQTVEVRVPTLSRSFPGRVARFTGKLSSSTRTMDTEVDVQNPGLVLLPGMYAEVDLTLAKRNKVLTIPTAAVDPHRQVMIVTAANRIELRTLTLGLESPDRIEVKSGLSVGDLVVIAGRGGLEANDVVKPKVTEMTAAKE